MSTYQPPGEPPSYAQPQDPWANAHETGVAAAPTDPIPQPQQQPYGQFAPGVAAPSAWTQETVAHGGYEYVPQQRSRLGMYLLVGLAVIVFGGGGGYGAYYLITHNGFGSPQGGQTTSPSTSSPSTASTVPVTDLGVLKIGDCVINTGSNDDATLALVACSTKDSYKITKITVGEQITEDSDGGLGDKAGLELCGSGSPYFAYNSDNDVNDRLVCLARN
jgi:hypothetical protein